MGLFSSSSSHLDQIRKDCVLISKRAAEARERCDKSLRGKHEMMDADERAELLKQARTGVREAKKQLEAVRDRQRQMDEDKCTSEDILAAHARVLEASLDVQRAEKAIEDGRQSLAQAIGEIEAFFGAGSPEAKAVRRVVAELEAG